MTKKGMKTLHPMLTWFKDVEVAINSRPKSYDEEISTVRLRNARKQLSELAEELIGVVDELDPIKMPSSVFDPSNPETIGRVVALALLSQPRISMAEIPRFYGSGIYAIYYKGSFDAYKSISSKEHPIYVGKADPALPNARSPKEQGEKVCKRLKEHLKSISKAENLSIEEFECRFLVVASGQQEAAERYLISLYRPIWNKETKICYGIGKHGDSATTRGNKRSPWDTMHSGRHWAGATTSDQVAESEIKNKLKLHFQDHPPFNTREEAMDIFLDQMCQQ